MSKLLITSGCSFSECITFGAGSYTWPNPLFEQLSLYGFHKHISCAMGSAGNGLISRRVIYQVMKALETYRPDDMLVAVMWSGANRHDFRYEKTKELSIVRNNIFNGWIENPTNVIDDDNYKKWVILNVNWTDKEMGNEEAYLYYKHFFDDIGSKIQSIEHILRTQYILKDKKIKYFFTNYVDNNIVYDNEIANPEISYLYKNIDFTNYLPISSAHRWIWDNCNDDEWKKHHGKGAWIHPNKEHYFKLVEQVMMPWLLEKNYLRVS